MSEYITFPNVGYLSAKVPAPILEVLKEEVGEIASNFSSADSESAGLAGHLLHEYKLKKSKQVVEPYIIQLMEEFNSKSGYLDSINLLEVSQKYFLDTLWVNLQGKHEFNPVHSHAGVISFVIWLGIPYALENENKVFPNKPEYSSRAGRFAFFYTDALGRIRPHIIDTTKDFEGTICLFPSCLNHGVYPFFTSDKFRVSVSGNIKFAAKGLK